MWSGFLRFTADKGRTTSLAYCTLKRLGAGIYHLVGMPTGYRALQGVEGEATSWRIELFPLNSSASRPSEYHGEDDGDDDALPRFLLCNVHSDAVASKILTTFWQGELATPGESIKSGPEPARSRDSQTC